MKNLLIICLSFSLLIIGACKKKESTKSTTPPPTAYPNSFKLKKDGVPYDANYVFVSLVDEDVLSVETRMVYNQVDNNTYGVFIKRSIPPGTYVSEEESEYFSIYHIQDPNTLFGWETNTLTVLSNDTVQKILHCTFEATLYNDDCDGNCPEITEGEMTIHY